MMSHMEICLESEDKQFTVDVIKNQEPSIGVERETRHG